jgi:heptaprenyl diphosphate synthase
MNYMSKRVAFTGIFAAAAIVLSLTDSILSAGLPPGIRFGLANTAVFAAAVLSGRREAFAVMAVKCLFVFLTRGLFAGAMSLSGSLPALALMIILLYKTRRGYVFISAVSAVVHAAGQIIFATFITESFFTLFYAPIMIIAATVTGILTGIICSKVIAALPDNEGKLL